MKSIKAISSFLMERIRIWMGNFVLFFEDLFNGPEFTERQLVQWYEVLRTFNPIHLSEAQKNLTTSNFIVKPFGNDVWRDLSKVW